jgi:hypothetical protein
MLRPDFWLATLHRRIGGAARRSGGRPGGRSSPRDSEIAGPRFKSECRLHFPRVTRLVSGCPGLFGIRDESTAQTVSGLPRTHDVARPAWSCLTSSASKPSLQVASIDDAEYQDHAIGVDDVAHHPVVADAHPVERVVGPADGLDGLAGDASRAGDVMGESLGGLTDALAVGASKLLELPYRRPRELDLVRGQSRSSSRTVRRSAKSARACLR